MKSPYINELEPNQVITGLFLVHHKDIRQKKSGDPYLSLTLVDRTGDLDAKMWDNAAEVLDAFERDPGSVKLQNGGARAAVNNREPLYEQNLYKRPEARVGA